MVRKELKWFLEVSIKSLISSLLDPDNLLVQSHEHNMIIGLQYEPFVIPCKPTSPKVKVELIKEYGEVMEYSFNETIGFHVVSNDSIEGGMIFCNFSLNDKIDILEFMFDVDRRFYYLITIKSYNLFYQPIIKYLNIIPINLV